MPEYKWQGSHDEARFQDRIVAATQEGICLHRLNVRKSSTPIKVHNASDGFRLIMPTLSGRVRLDRESEGVYEGIIKLGTVRFVQPDERAQVTPLTALDEMMLYIPGGMFRQRAVSQGFSIKGELCPQLLPVVEQNYAVQRLVPLLDLANGMSLFRCHALIQGLATSLMALLLESSVHRSREVLPNFEEKHFERITKFADARLGQHLDLAEWAEVAELSPGEFARRFQQHTGVAPYTWFMDRRIDEAKRLLARGEMSLVEVALESGFCSQSHFTEAFRRRVGASPGRWRRSQYQLKSV